MHPSPVYSNKLGLFSSRLLIAPDVAPLIMSLWILEDDDLPEAIISAATPATCGAAMDVPEMELSALALPIHVDLMYTPGAKTLTQLP